MKIKEFSIIEYGPLPERGKFILEDFNLFYGSNESGKTLTIDALIKLLIGKSTDQFKNLDRVEGKPEGYVILKTHDDKKLKLHGKKKVSNVIEISLNDFSNLFIIRNSDLELYKEDEFYNSLTDRLLGLRINDINKIIKRLIDIGKLTSSARQFRNIGDEKFLDKVNEAESCIKEIDNLIEDIKERDFDTLEEKHVNINSQIQLKKQKIQAYEEARKRETYQKGIHSSNSLKRYDEEIEKLKSFNENDKDLWNKKEDDNNNLIEKREKKLLKLRDLKDNLIKTRNELHEKELDFENPTKIKIAIEENYKPIIKDYEMKLGRVASKAEKVRYFTSVFYVSALLFGIFFFAGMVSTLILGYFLAILFGILSVLIFFYKFQYIRDKAHLKGVSERLKVELVKYGLSGENVNEISLKIQKFIDNFNINQINLNDLKNSIKRLEEKINTLESEDIPELNNELDEIKNIIEKIKEKSNTQTLEEYISNFKIKKEYIKKSDEEKAILKNIFGVANETVVEENLRFWEDEIEKLEIFKDKYEEIKFNEEMLTQLNEEKEKLSDKLDQIETRMDEIKARLSQFEIKVNYVLSMEKNHLYCNTSNDLKEIQRILMNFLNQANEKKDNILDIIEICNDIELREKEKISKL